MRNEGAASPVTQQTLAAWRSALVTLRDEERRRGGGLAAETGRLLEVVGQALAQGGGVLSADDIAQLEELTHIRQEGR
jgi:hypothetical protein